MEKRSDMKMKELEESLIKYMKQETMKTKCINTKVLENRIKTYDMNRKTEGMLLDYMSKDGAFKDPKILKLVETEKKIVTNNP